MIFSVVRPSITEKMRCVASTLVPSLIGRLPYVLALKCLQNFASHDMEIWPRHSYVTQNFMPFVSDLDLTFWYENDPLPLRVAKTMRAYQTIRRAFPWLGEPNLYSRSDLNFLAYFANPWELARDPTLQSRVSLIERPRESAKAVFVLRMLDADFIGLLGRTNSRIKKWRGHYQALNVLFPEQFDLVSVVNLALDLVDLDTQQKTAARSSILNYLEMRARLQHIEKPDPNQRIFFPHRFCYSLDSIPNLSRTQAEIVKEQILWEIGGLWGQFRFYAIGPQQESRQLLAHLAKLKCFLEQGFDEKDEGTILLKAGLRELTERFEAFCNITKNLRK